MPAQKNIRELSLPELKEYFELIGDKKFRAIQAYEWLWKKMRGISMT
jgi:23S rRNA (adenine2503-C2)-methyltransferase